MDLPALAGAIVDYYRGRVRASRVYQAQIEAVYLEGPGVDILVRQEDWLKIIPHLVDGTFAPQNSAVIKPRNTTDDTPAPQANPEFYGRVLLTLQTIFTDDFPTSPL